MTRKAGGADTAARVATRAYTGKQNRPRPARSMGGTELGDAQDSRCDLRKHGYAIAPNSQCLLSILFATCENGFEQIAHRSPMSN